MIVHGGMAIYFYNWYQKNPIVYDPLPIKIVSKTVRTGESVFTTTSRCAKDNYEITVTRQLIDGLVYSLPKGSAIVPKGCTTISRLLFVVPEELPSGTYYSQSVIDVPVHWLYFNRTDRIPIYTEPFTIIAPRIDPEAATDSK
jgi:hypothetical protein